MPVACGARRHSSGWQPAASCSGCFRSQVIALHRPGHPHAGRRRPRRPVAAQAGCCSPRSSRSAPSYGPLVFLLVIGGKLRAGVSCSCAGSTTAGAPRRSLGLRLPVAEPAHAGHRRRLRPADPPDLRAVLPHGARAAVAVRSRSRATASASRTTSGTGSTCRSRGWPRRCRAGRPAPAGADLRLPALQLRDAAGVLVLVIR